jgi:hypothetical protein
MIDEMLYKQMKLLLEYFYFFYHFYSFFFVCRTKDSSEFGLVFTMTVEEEVGVVKDKPLIENGENVDVTNDNREKYVKLIVAQKLGFGTRDQLKKIRKGFEDIVPLKLLVFNDFNFIYIL